MAGVKDSAGNPTTSDFSWTFTTAPPPPPPPTQGPGGPILVVTAASNPFTTYYAEILRSEGANLFATIDLSQVTSTVLADYDVVVLGETPLTSSQVTMFTTWVNGGGKLIAMRPDKQLAGLLGLTDAAATLADAYLLVNTATAPGLGIVSQTIQFHGTADRYTLNGASALATLYSNATTATANPAVTTRTVGAGGQRPSPTILRGRLYTRARAIPHGRDRNATDSHHRSSGRMTCTSARKVGDVKPDYVDFNKIAIPQADEQQRFLWNIILNMNAAKKPLPRFWYFPRMLPAVVVMTGDDHANNGTAPRFDEYLSASAPDCWVVDWGCIGHVVHVSEHSDLRCHVANYVGQGFEIALHVTTGLHGLDTHDALRISIRTQLSQFAGTYPSAPTPVTNRTHCIVWSDWTTQASRRTEPTASGSTRTTTTGRTRGSTIVPACSRDPECPQRFANLTAR